MPKLETFLMTYKPISIVKPKSMALKPILFILIAYGLSGCQSGAKKTDETFAGTNLNFDATFARLEANELKYYKDAVNKFFDSTSFLKNLNGSILIAKNGTVIFENYYGYKDPHLKDTLTAETPIQIASTTKTFTGIALLQLVQRGKINLNDSLTKFFPGFPYAGITVKMLLNHRSGLPEYLYYFEKGVGTEKIRNQ